MKKYSVWYKGVKQQRLNRYYPSTKGAYIYKSKDGGITLNHMMKGQPVELFNNFILKNTKSYNIDYQYFISECNKIIELLEPKQLSLF